MNPFERAHHLTKEIADKTLVIVDMQQYFVCVGSVEHKMAADMCLLIQHAMANKWGIILVEYDGSGDTIKLILDTVSGYQHLEIVKKSEQNGGPEVIACLDSNPKWSMNLIVCGIFGDQCVPDTVRGIFDNSDIVEIDVVTDLIYPSYTSYYDEEDEGEEREITMEHLGLQKICEV